MSVIDKHLAKITGGVRRRVKAGKGQGELFARKREDWYDRVAKIAEAVGRSAEMQDGDLLIDTVGSLAAATYFATLPEGKGSATDEE